MYMMEQCQEHQEKAWAIGDGSTQFYSRIGQEQQQDKARDAQQRADAVRHGIADFFQHGTLRRFVMDFYLLLFCFLSHFQFFSLVV